LHRCAGARGTIDGRQCKAVHAKARHCTPDKRTTLWAQIDARIEGDLQALDGQDTQEDAGTPGDAVADHVQAEIEELQQRKLRYAEGIPAAPSGVRLRSTGSPGCAQVGVG